MIYALILMLAFATVMIYTTFLHYMRGDFTKRGFAFWITMWLGVIGLAVVFIFAQDYVRTFVEQKLKFRRFMDLVMVMGLAFFAFVAFHNYAVLSKMRRQVENLVRNSALAEADKELKPGERNKTEENE